MAYYDIGEVFQKIEEDMIASMMRNLKRHLATEKEEGLNYAMWQSEQLAALNEFKRNNSSLFKGYFSTINEQIEEVLKKAHETGKMEQEIKILEAIREGWSTALKPSGKIQGAFFRINDRKLKALINSVNNDMKKAETAMLRRANDEYRKIIFNSQAYYNTGAGTLPQCVDMATKDFLSKGISCIEYANGARVGIDAYSRMAIRTASTRAYLLGESAKRDEWGVSTVIVNKRGVACPRCLRYVGRVFYDDVWGSAPIPYPEKYPRLSEAIAGGLYHPNCRDVHTTYFEGISTPPKPMTAAEKKEAERVYNLEQQQRYNERQIRKYKRLSDGSVDPENQLRYQKKLEAWQAEQRRFVKANGDVLKRRYENEAIYDIGPIDNYDTRRAVESMKREVEIERLQALKKDLTNAGNSDIIKSKWDNDLPPRGQITEKIPEEELYSFVAKELGAPIERATEYAEAIMNYTDWSSDIYGEIRRYQRGETLKFMSLDEVKKLSDDIEEYIQKAPRWNGGITYRGVSVSDDELASYIAGKEFTSGGTASWSIKKSVARDFAMRNTSAERPNSVIYHCDTQSKGTGIRHISLAEFEEEVLCSTESKYVVERVETDEEYIHHVYLKEV